MNANEVMLESAITLLPDETVREACLRASEADIDILPVVDRHGLYVGAVPKTTLVDHAKHDGETINSLCCTDALVCAPDFAVEHLQHDATSSVPHQTIIVVDANGKFRGVVPWVHWAVDEAKVQSGHPRNPLEVRTHSMHLTWRCLDCGALSMRNSGIPEKCPHCGANAEAFALYTED